MSEKTTETTVQKTASLHEKAVQAIARGDVSPQPRKARRLAVVGPDKPSTDVHTHVKLEDLVLAEVQRILASPDNSYTRYEIVDAETAVVR